MYNNNDKRKQRRTNIGSANACKQRSKKLKIQLLRFLSPLLKVSCV